jgi:hypothetical protein
MSPRALRSGRGRAIRGALAYRRSAADSPKAWQPLARLQARLPGTRSSRALPALSCPSPVAAPHTPVVMPKSMMPEAARERFANPARGHRTRSAIRLASGMRPSMSENVLARNGYGDGCQIRSLDWRCCGPYKPLKIIHFLRMDHRICSPPRALRPQRKIDLTFGKIRWRSSCHEESVTAFRAQRSGGSRT